MAWVEAFRTDELVAVLDIGGRNINGTPRHLFPNATVYTVLDIAAGPGVDIVADAAHWKPDRAYDVVVCCEVFEHTKVWPAILETIHKALTPDGLFIATMAGPGRATHSAVDGGPELHPGEHYKNVDAKELRTQLFAAGFFRDVFIHEQTSSHDVRVVAYR